MSIFVMIFVGFINILYLSKTYLGYFWEFNANVIVAVIVAVAAA